MKKSIDDLPAIDGGTTFRVSTCTYNLTFTYGHWVLVRVTGGKLHEKSDLTNKDIEQVFAYIAAAERCTEEEVRMTYENAKKTD